MSPSTVSSRPAEAYQPLLAAPSEHDSPIRNSPSASRFDIETADSHELGAPQNSRLMSTARELWQSLPSKETLKAYLPTKKQAGGAAILLLLGGSSWRNAVATNRMHAALGRSQIQVDELLRRHGIDPNIDLSRERGAAEECAERAGDDQRQLGDFNTQEWNFRDANGTCSPAGKHYADAMANHFVPIAEDVMRGRELNCSQYGAEVHSIGLKNVTSLEAGELRWRNLVSIEKNNRTLNAEELRNARADFRKAQAPGLRNEARILDAIDGSLKARNISAPAQHLVGEYRAENAKEHDLLGIGKSKDPCVEKESFGNFFMG